MKLINTSTHRIEDLGGSQPPEPYAILSHTWCADHEEVTYQEMLLEDHMNLRNRPGYRKIEEACRRAREAPYHLKYAWIDTVCIDKTSSAELSEAINSMFRYYREAAVCFALLSGWTHDSGLAAFQKCKWFQRGWCLQELIAPLPRSLEFFDEAWVRLGTKHDLAEDIERATKINTGVLTGQIMLDKVPVAVRMSWASSRQTRRVEDRAYSLLGIMGINMSMLYGEGSDAFLRLQAEIIRQSTDMSIFAWTTSGTQKYMGLLAPCPEVFEHSQALVSQPHALLPAQEYSITNRGIKFEMTLNQHDESGYFLLPVSHGFKDKDSGVVAERGVLLRQVGADLFVRASPNELPLIHEFATEWPLYISASKFFHIKMLSPTDSQLIEERVLKVMGPPAATLVDLGLRTVDPAGCWDPSQSFLYAGHAGAFLGYMTFAPIWADEFDSFVLVCYFNGGWACNLVRGDHWNDRRPKMFEYYKNGANMDNIVARVELPHLYLDGIAKAVTAEFVGESLRKRSIRLCVQ